MAKVLIADDSAFMRVMLKEIITRLGHSVIGEASDGIEVLEMYSSKQPDLITMDITMPNMNGMEAISKLKALDPSCRIVVCSAQDQAEIVAECLSKGAQGFIPKPFQADLVAATISRALAGD